MAAQVEPPPMTRATPGMCVHDMRPLGQPEEPLTKKNAEIFFDDAHVFIINCEGVLWDSEGLVEGAVETIQNIRDTGKKVVYVSSFNKTQQQLYDELISYGFPVGDKKFVITPDYLIVRNLAEIGFEGKVYLVGNESTTGKLLKEEGIEWVETKPEEPTPEIEPGDPIDTELFENVKCVILGYGPQISYHQIMNMCSYLKDPDCLYYATSECRFRVAKDTENYVLDTGCVSSMIDYVTQRESIQVGLPTKGLFNFIKNEFGVSNRKAVVIGATRITDMLFANTNKMRCLLLDSEDFRDIHLPEKEEDIHPLYRPDFHGENIAAFGDNLFP